MPGKKYFLVFTIFYHSFAGAIQTSASELKPLNCGVDQVEDEVIEQIPLSEICSKNPKNLSKLSDFNGGGMFGDFDGKGAVKRGTLYTISKELINSHNTGKICFYVGCRKLAVNQKGAAPTESASRWHVCQQFKGGTSISNKKFSNCPAAIKVTGKFRELIESIKDTGKSRCCYEADAPVAP